MCWLTPQQLRKVEDDMAETARKARERQTRLLAALHAAARDLRGTAEFFDDSVTTPLGEFMHHNDAKESEENWKLVEQCVAALDEHGVSIDEAFEGQEVKR